MGLRRALASLPDDRATVTAAREVAAFLDMHPGEPFIAERIMRSTGVSAERITPVLSAFAAAFVIDCDGDPRRDECVYHPDSVLEIEVRRFLRGADGATHRLQGGVDRYRDRFGRA